MKKFLASGLLFATINCFSASGTTQQVKTVLMFQVDSITLSATQGGNAIISTNGVFNCIAAALIVQKANKDQYVIMAHYPPSNSQFFVSGMKHHAASLLSDQAAPTQHKQLVVLVPEEYKQDENGCYSIREVPPNYLPEIEALRQAFGLEPVVSLYNQMTLKVKNRLDINKLLPYSRAQNSNFSVELTGEGAIWRSFGEHHKNNYLPF